MNCFQQTGVKLCRHILLQGHYTPFVTRNQCLSSLVKKAMAEPKHYQPKETVEYPESSPISQLSKYFLTLPRTVQVRSGENVKIDWFKDEHIPAIFKLIKQVVDDGTAGFSETEFETEEKLRWHLGHAYGAVSGVEINSGHPVCVMWVAPSPLVRSVSPVMHAGYIVMETKYQNSGLGRQLMSMFSVLGMQGGYIGTMGRSMLVHAPVVVGVIRVGSKIGGWIPRSLSTKRHGITDDIIVDNDYTHLLPVRQPTLPEILDRINKGKLLRPNKRFENMFTGVKLKTDLKTSSGIAITVRHAEEEELANIFHLLSKAADNGDSFGLDEFPTFDIFTNRFLHGRTAFVIEKSGEIVGVAVMGPSYLCRAYKPENAMLYIYLVPEQRQKGIGSVVIQEMIELAKKDHFSGMLIDVFINSRLPYKYVKKFKFTLVGTIRNSAFVKGEGLTDCAVFYRDFMMGHMNNMINMSNL